MSFQTVAEPTTARGANASTPLSRADLVLVRLLAGGKKPPSPREVRESLAKLYRQPGTVEDWDAEIAGLRERGMIEGKAMRLTEAGRAVALARLGVASLPAGIKWQTLLRKHLLPIALGLPDHARDARKRIEKNDGLAALLLKRKHGLPASAGQTLNAVLEALACKELGFPQVTTMAQLKAAALNRLLKTDDPLDAQQLLKQVPLVDLDVPPRPPTAMTERTVQRWLERETPPGNGSSPPVEHSPEPIDLAEFASTVYAAARACPTGRFGDHKVFISHVWRQVKDEPMFRSFDLATFKQHLIEANAKGLLTLTRADLPQVLDPIDVRESEANYLNASFHFVYLDKEEQR